MKIICIGRNYHDHIVELGNEVNESPVVFFKYEEHLQKGEVLKLPAFSKDIHYECELVYRFSKDIPEDFNGEWQLYIDSVTLGLDLTARDVQTVLKSKGLPWDISKNFKGSAVIGQFVPLHDVMNSDEHMTFNFYKNENCVQEGHTELMIYNLNELITFVSKYIEIKKGDVIFTGTPKGVGRIESGDKYLGHLKGIEVLSLRVE